MTRDGSKHEVIQARVLDIFGELCVEVVAKQSEVEAEAKEGVWSAAHVKQAPGPHPNQ